MGKVFEELTRASKSCSVANTANLAKKPDVRRFAEIASTRMSDRVVAGHQRDSSPDCTRDVCDEGELRKRCQAVCAGLSIPPESLFEAMTTEDKEAQFTGEEDMRVLRAFACALSERLISVGASGLS